MAIAMQRNKRVRENPCFICGHYHRYEEGEICNICGQGAGAGAPRPRIAVPLVTAHLPRSTGGGGKREAEILRTARALTSAPLS